MTPEEFIRESEIQPKEFVVCGHDFTYYTEADVIKLLEEYGLIKYDEGFVEGLIY